MRVVALFLARGFCRDLTYNGQLLEYLQVRSNDATGVRPCARRLVIATAGGGTGFLPSVANTNLVSHQPNDRETKDLNMASTKVPPAKAARVVERARHHLNRLHQRMVPPHAAILDLIAGAWTAQAITATADLGVADALAKAPLSIDELAAAVDADPDTLSRLLRALISRGIFRQRRDGRYELTPLADALRSDADVSMAPVARWLGSTQ